MGFDLLVNLFRAFHGDAEEIVGKAADFRFHAAALTPERATHFVGVLSGQVSLKEHLQNKFAGLAAGTHENKLSAVSYQLSVYKSSEEVDYERFFVFLPEPEA
jgi:hydroxymethylglutaryl-CoA reductase